MSDIVDTAEREPSSATRPGHARTWAQRRPSAGWRWVCPLAAFLLWLGSLPLIDLSRLGGWGLVTCLPLTWYAALALIVITYTHELRRTEPQPWMLAACQAVLVALLFGTTALTYAVPRYPWTYKHIGVTEAILSGGIHRSADIYNNYPGFFLVAAAMSGVLRVSVQTLAQYAELAFALLDSVAVWWAVGGLTRRTDARWGTVLLFTLGNWIGQTYFAPQSFAFLFSILVIGGVLRAAAGSPRWQGWAGTTSILAAYAVVVVSHQLSPVLVLLQVGALWAFRRGVRWWLVAAFLAIEAIWTALAWGYLSTQAGLFHFSLFDNVKPPSAGLRPALAGATFAQRAGPVLIVLIAMLAVAGFVLAWRRGRLPGAWTPAMLMAAPVVVLVAQAYGNEGTLRIYLFALPWAGFLICTELLGLGGGPAPHRRRAARAVALGIVAVVTVLGVVATLALELVNHVAPNDVAAARWFETNTAPGSTLVVLNQGSPTRVTNSYADHIRGDHIATVVLSDNPEATAAAGDPQLLEDLVINACSEAAHGAPVYLITGPGPAAYAELYGLMTTQEYDALVGRLAADPDVDPVFRSGASTVWQCVP